MSQHLLKVAFAGDIGQDYGKQQLIVSLLTNCHPELTFPEELPTLIGPSTISYTTTGKVISSSASKGSDLLIEIHDTSPVNLSSLKISDALRRTQYRGVSCVIVVLSLAGHLSFGRDSIKKEMLAWMADIHAEVVVPVIFVGTGRNQVKEAKWTPEEGTQSADELGAVFYTEIESLKFDKGKWDEVFGVVWDSCKFCVEKPIEESDGWCLIC